MRYVISCTALCLLALGLSVPQSACGAKPTFATPKAQVIYTADQVAIRINELQNAAINAEAHQGLPTDQARTIVEWCVASNRVLATAPADWRVTLAITWELAKQKIGPVANPALGAAMGIVDAVVDLTPGVPR